jgi:hypothetical protein
MRKTKTDQRSGAFFQEAEEFILEGQSFFLEFFNIVIRVDFDFGLTATDLMVECIVFVKKLCEVAVGDLEFMDTLLELREFVSKIVFFAQHESFLDLRFERVSAMSIQSPSGEDHAISHPTA